MSGINSFDYEYNKHLLASQHTGLQKEMIMDAFDFARKKHERQKRKTGEPYDQHPIRVALKLNELHADYETICAALLHDVIEDCDVSVEKIAERFNENIANLVDGVTKISTKDKNSKTLPYIQTINKLILTIPDDVRSIIIKIADRLDNMETIHGHKEEEKRRKIARETLDVYVPIATLFGFYKTKEDFEERCFIELDKDSYNKVQAQKNYILGYNQSLCTKLVSLKSRETDDSLYKLLSSNGLPIDSIRLKDKGLYSIYRNLIENKVTDITQVIDLITYRIIIDSEQTDKLYSAMGLVNKDYPMLNGSQYSVRDYISFPKNELYRALLTYNLLLTDNEKVQVHFEYQTPSMSKLSDYGIASFWDYDNMQAVKDMQAYVEGMPVYTFLKYLSNGYQNGAYDDTEFFYLVKKLIFSKRIYIKLPGFDFKQTYEGITLEDFIMFNNDGFVDLNKIYYVNGKKVRKNYVLHNNDYVEAINRNDKDLTTNVFGGITRGRRK